MAELVKSLLAYTGLPQVYRKVDCWCQRCRKSQFDELDLLTRDAARLFFSHFDVASQPPMSRVILYGSRARGGHRDDSDVDVMLVFAGAEPDYFDNVHRAIVNTTTR